MGKVKWNNAALGRAIGLSPEVTGEVRAQTIRIAYSANAMGLPFRTGFYHRNHKSPAVGGTQPVYGSDAQVMGNCFVGIVYTGNYAAMCDNARNNTLLKAMG